MAQAQTKDRKHIAALDGWRGISILCVISGHMLPLGPKAIGLNSAIANVGMALFFTLSGFLIVSMLIANDCLLSFLVRRACRILPLAWLYLLFVLTITGAPFLAWSANFLFYANLPPFYLEYLNAHFWSLCVEVQFYIGIAMCVFIFARNGLVLVPLACVIVTVARVLSGNPVSIVTWFRLDEILAGGCLAIVVRSGWLQYRAIPLIAPFILLPFLLLASHPAFPITNYCRPYIAAALVGSTIYRREDTLQRFLQGRVLSYLAEISYALYVVHPITYAGWMGSGDVVTRYGKRIVSFLLSFSIAHVSTRYIERHFINVGHRIAHGIEMRRIKKVSIVG